MRFSIRNVLMVGFMAVIFILVIKVIFTKYPVTGISEVVQAV